MATNEFRVRPVTRYIVTHHITEGEGGGSTCGCGEFDSRDQAVRVGEALTAATPGATFEIVGRHGESMGCS